MNTLELYRPVAEDAETVAHFLRYMLEEMATMGGYPPAEGPEAWPRVMEVVHGELARDDHLYVLGGVDDKPEPVCFGEALILEGHPLLKPFNSLHISAVYVLPEFRRNGIARHVTEYLLAWGRRKGCTEADLNVLLRNPARQLYEACGFTASDLKMTMRL